MLGSPMKKVLFGEKLCTGVELKEGDSELNSRQAITQTVII
jgi:hypothetical protein